MMLLGDVLSSLSLSTQKEASGLGSVSQQESMGIELCDIVSFVDMFPPLCNIVMLAHQLGSKGTVSNPEKMIQQTSKFMFKK